MGRPERVVDPADGPVQELAWRLRQLRNDAGRPTYRELSRRTHYSPSVLSRAAAGNTLPSLSVTLALARACGGDAQEWTRLWREVAAAVHSTEGTAEPDQEDDEASGLLASMTTADAAAGHAAKSDGPSTDAASDSLPDAPLHDSTALAASSAPHEADDPGVRPAVPDPDDRARPRHRHRVPRWALWTATFTVLLGGAVLGVWSASGSTPSGTNGWTTGRQNAGDLHEADNPEPMDGDDPRARGCFPDAVVLQQVPILLPGGQLFGTLRLRHSNHCGTDWASAYYANPQLFTVTLTAVRPADGADVRSQWSNNTPPGSYGDMLSTALGCVWVDATVATPWGVSPTAHTACLR